MCGRFTLDQEADAIANAFTADVAPIRPVHRPRYNIAPTEDAPVVVAARGGRCAGPMRWVCCHTGPGIRELGPA